MTTQHRIKTRSLSPIVSLLLLLLSFPPAFSPAQTAKLGDQGTVFNVKAYGATGDGAANDTSAIQRAIDAAITAHGGIVYFPPGTYLLSGTLHNSRADRISLVGSGMASRLMINSNLGISLDPTSQHVGDSGFHSGRIQGLYMKCANQASATAVQMTDMVAAPQLSDLSISNCNTAFDIINKNYWTERLVASNITDHYNNHLFHYNQNPKSPNNSYGYGIYNGIFVNKAAGQDVFYLTGGAYIYHSTFVVKGNLEKAKNASIYNIQGSFGEPCSGMALNVYDIATEGDSYFVVKTSSNGCRPGSTGNALVAGIGTAHAVGATALASPGSVSSITDPKQASYLAVPVFIATDSSSDTVSAANVTPAAKCFVQPTDATSANAMTQTYVSDTNWLTVTIHHPSTAQGGRFQVWCTP